MRQLAKIIKVEQIKEHTNANALEIVKVGLWEIVVRKNEFQIGQNAIMFEIDSMLPLSDERFAFLAGRKDYVVNGITYARLKTIRLRGVLSQGLLVPADLFEKEIAEFQKEDNTLSLQEILGVIKYEPPEDNFGGSNRIKNTPGDTRPFPVFIPKTDQERIQNFVYEYNAIVDKFNTNDPSQFEYFEVTYKLDGSSITMYSAFNKLGVCSRNLEINMPYDWSDWPARESHFIKAAIDSGIMFKLAMHYSATGRSIALQGELCLDGNSLVSTPGGFVELKDIVVGDAIYSNDNIVEVIAKHDNGVKKTFLYTFSNGISIRATPDHKVMVFDKNGFLYKKELQEIQNGEYVACYYNSPNILKEYLPLIINNYEDKYSSRKNICIFPKCLREDFAYLLGIIYAEGCVIRDKYKKVSSKISITLHKNEINIANKIIGIAKTIIPNGVTSKVVNNTRIIFLNSTLLIKYLDDNKLLKQKADDLIFPKNILKSKQSVINAFISGYYDGDGDTDIKRFRFSSNSLKFLQVMQQCILAQGCPVNLRYRKNSNGKTLHCVAVSSFTERYDILMLESIKYKYSVKPKKSYLSYPFRYIDNLPDDDKSKVSAKINNGIYRLDSTSVSNLNGIIRYTDDIEYANYLNFIKQHIIPVSIINIEKPENTHVYDLTIDDVQHAYIANSIYVSNCGPGIQSNFEGLTKHEIFIYDVYDIDAGQYMLPDERRKFLTDLGIQQVPVHSYNVWLPTPIEAILEMADGPSGLNGQFREGLVFKSMERDFSFKAISNAYLESTGK